MATTEQVAAVRAQTNEFVNEAPFTDDYISGLIDALGPIAAEKTVWVAKRNAAADLVAISEGGSSRSNQQVFEHYSKIVQGYEDAENAGGLGGQAPRTREITRA